MCSILRLIIVISFFLLNMGYAYAESLERRAADLFSVIRCMVCNGEAIKDSQTEFASVIRGFVTKEIQKGKSDDEIIEFLKRKYGESIILKPAFSISTFALWAMPYIVLILLLFIVFLRPYIVRPSKSKLDLLSK